MEEQAFDWMAILKMVLALLVPIAGVLSVTFPSVGKIMKVVDLIAFNWGKARNDPGSQ